MAKRSFHARLGERIRTLRLQRRVPQNVLARMIGISPGALTNFEKGRRRISLDWLQKIAQVASTPLAYFLGEAEMGRGNPSERRLLEAWRTPPPTLRRDFLQLIAHLGELRGRRRW